MISECPISLPVSWAHVTMVTMVTAPVKYGTVIAVKCVEGSNKSGEWLLLNFPQSD